MPSPSFRSASSSSSINVSAYSCSKPSGVVQGDLLLAFHTINTTPDPGNSTVTGGATWTNMPTGFNWTKIYWKFAGSGEPSSYSLSNAFSSTVSSTIIVVAVQNPTAVSPTLIPGVNSTTTTHPSPSFTPSSSSDLDIRYFGGFAVSASANIITPPSGYTEAAETFTSSGIVAAAAYKQLISASPPGIQNFTSIGNFDGEGFTVKIPDLIQANWSGWGMPA